MIKIPCDECILKVMCINEKHINCKILHAFIPPVNSRTQEQLERAIYIRKTLPNTRMISAKKDKFSTSTRSLNTLIENIKKWGNRI
jgi:hypothetical protein